MRRPWKTRNARSDILTKVTVKIPVFSEMTQCGLVQWPISTNTLEHLVFDFGPPRRVPEEMWSGTILKMETASSAEDTGTYTQIYTASSKAPEIFNTKDNKAYKQPCLQRDSIPRLQRLASLTSRLQFKFRALKVRSTFDQLGKDKSDLTSPTLVKKKTEGMQT
jgi:hypothetical protein